MALSSAWQVAADIGGGLLSSLVGGNLMSSSAASQQDRQFSHNWGLMDHQAFLNEQAMRLQNQLNRGNYAERYQLATQDLRKAGLNPILAATQGVGGNIQGAAALGSGLGSVGMGAVPDYASGFSSAVQGALVRKVQNQQLGLAQKELDLKKLDVNSSIAQRENDMAISKGRYELEKWSAQESMRLKQIMQDAQIKNMTERLQAEIEHMARQDANGAVSAAAAMAQANASGLMAAVQEKLGISREQLNEAQQAYIALQSENAEESLKWQRWLNDHPGTRGAVGLLGSFFDTFALVKGVKNIGNSLGDIVGGD